MRIRESPRAAGAHINVELAWYRQIEQGRRKGYPAPPPIYGRALFGLHSIRRGFSHSRQWRPCAPSRAQARSGAVLIRATYRKPDTEKLGVRTPQRPAIYTEAA